MLPGDLFSRDRLIRSYQNVSNLGFFQQPMPSPDVKPAANGVDVDIIFRVEEKRTGNINFGASLGQGTGVGGFLGLEEPNLFGRGKRGKLPVAVRQEHQRLHAELHRSRHQGEPDLRARCRSSTRRARYTVGDLGRRKQTGGIAAARLPVPRARATPGSSPRTRYQRITLQRGLGRPAGRASAARSCVRSTLGASVLRDTRFGLPFATGGSSCSVSGELNGGFLGGTGDYQKVDLEGRWYAPLGTMGGRRAARRRGTVRARAHRQVRLHLRRRRAVLHRAVLAGRRAVRHPAARLRRVLHHPERLRPAAERQPRRARTRSASRTRRSRWRPGRGSASRCT